MSGFIQLPIHAIRPPWDEAIDSVQKPFISLLIPNEPLEWHLSINEGLYNIALHWVFKKKWQSKYRIPAKANVAKAVEPLGEFLFRILDLCSECHLVAGSGYTAAEWFKGAVWEMKRGDFAAILSPQKKGEGKKKHCQVIQEEVRLLKRWNNPYRSLTSPYTYRLIDVALKLADRGNNDVFVKKVWRPFLDAYSKWATALSKNPDWVYLTIKNGQLYMQAGRGRAKLRVSA